MSAIVDLEERTRQIVDDAGPAVVAVGGRGAGVVVGEGFVLTNAHNLRSEEITVTFADGETRVGGLAGADVDGDIAVVAVDTGGVHAPQWASVAADVGRQVLALARSRSGGLRVTLGTISATGQRFRGPGGRRLSGGIEHTAPLARGSSGGPLVDRDGHLLGINTNRLADGFYLALPADDDLRARVEALRGGISVERPRLGIGAAPATVARRLRTAVGLPPRDGVLVRAVAENSPAERAGLRTGDLIVAAGPEPTATVDDLHRALDGLGTGTATLTLEIVRGTEDVTLSVTFGTERGERARTDGEEGRD